VFAHSHVRVRAPWSTTLRLGSMLVQRRQDCCQRSGETGGLVNPQAGAEMCTNESIPRPLTPLPRLFRR
jgi:hypothetical protein